MRFPGIRVSPRTYQVTVIYVSPGKMFSPLPPYSCYLPHTHISLGTFVSPAHLLHLANYTFPTQATDCTATVVYTLTMSCITLFVCKWQSTAAMQWTEKWFRCCIIAHILYSFMYLSMSSPTYLRLGRGEDWWGFANVRWQIPLSFPPLGTTSELWIPLLIIPEIKSVWKSTDIHVANAPTLGDKVRVTNPHLLPDLG